MPNVSSNYECLCQYRWYILRQNHSPPLFYHTVIAFLKGRYSTIHSTSDRFFASSTRDSTTKRQSQPAKAGGKTRPNEFGYVTTDAISCMRQQLCNIIQRTYKAVHCEICRMLSNNIPFVQSLFILDRGVHSKTYPSESCVEMPFIRYKTDMLFCIQIKYVNMLLWVVGLGLHQHQCIQSIDDRFHLHPITPTIFSH